jgi:hypothetical protein
MKMNSAKLNLKLRATGKPMLTILLVTKQRQKQNQNQKAMLSLSFTRPSQYTRGSLLAPSGKGGRSRTRWGR